MRLESLQQEQRKTSLKSINQWHTAFKKHGKWVGIGGYGIPKVTMGGRGWAKPVRVKHDYPMVTQPGSYVGLLTIREREGPYLIIFNE
ncbi:hypothetical protein KFK09_013341 [Dendrobium nobile]|uniref:Uncharacterized protein n=1 Tax=Dendrobium nobile TaxID=94219 RepID=A0A8T3BCU1_DENNO|nr:hypothetical protein KFK09_013341 [Dendrobium nobile]